MAGDPEHRHMAMCDKQGGMHYHPNAIEILVRLHFTASFEFLLVCLIGLVVIEICWSSSFLSKIINFLV